MNTTMPGLGTAVAFLIVLVLVLLGVEFPDGYEALTQASLTTVVGFALHRLRIIHPDDRDEDGRVDDANDD